MTLSTQTFTPTTRVFTTQLTQQWQACKVAAKKHKTSFNISSQNCREFKDYNPQIVLPNGVFVPCSTGEWLEIKFFSFFSFSYRGRAMWICLHKEFTLNSSEYLHWLKDVELASMSPLKVFFSGGGGAGFRQHVIFFISKHLCCNTNSFALNEMYACFFIIKSPFIIMFIM